MIKIIDNYFFINTIELSNKDKNLNESFSINTLF